MYIVENKVWFISFNNQVLGPFSPNEIEDLHGQHPEALIWGKGLPEWYDYSRWKKVVDEIRFFLQDKLNHKKNWRYRINNKESHYMDYENLIEELAGFHDYHDLEIWSDNAGSWKELYFFEDLVASLGATRRKFPRVPIMGTYEFKTSQQKLCSGRLSSLSQGGMLLHDVPDLFAGERLHGVIKSPNLHIPITCNALVAYVRPDQSAGVKFDSLSAEAESVIMEYVKKFGELL